MFRGARQMTIGQQAIGTRRVRECPDRQTGMSGEHLQIDVLIDHAGPDQHLIRADPDAPAAHLRGLQQGGREQWPQAIELARRARLPVMQPVVFA